MSRVDPDKWYSVREAAGLLGVTEATVKVYCRAGEGRVHNANKSRAVKARKRGARGRWEVLGCEIKRLIKEWNLDE